MALITIQNDTNKRYVIISYNDATASPTVDYESVEMDKESICEIRKEKDGEGVLVVSLNGNTYALDYQLISTVGSNSSITDNAILEAELKTIWKDR